MRRSRSCCSGGAEFVVVECGAGEERLFAGGLVVLVVGEVFADEVDHEQGVDDPDAVGEVLSALVDVGEASDAGAFAGFRGDLDLERLGLGAGGECVELAVELVVLAGEDLGELFSRGGGELGAGALDLLGGVEHCAVVDADGVGVLVFDDRAVHERAEVAQCTVVQVGAGDALGDRLGEVGCDLVHVGEAVCHRDRQLLAGGALGDALADLLGEGELAAEVVRAPGGDAEVGADGEDALVVWQAGAGVPAVGELLLLVDEAELFALVGLGLDAPDLVGSRLVVEQQHDQGADRREVFEAVGSRQLVAGFGGEQAALSVVEQHGRLVGVGAVADAWDQLSGSHQQRGERLDAVVGDVLAGVRCELEVIERDALDRALDGRLGDGRDVEQGGEGQQRGVGVGHAGRCPFRWRGLWTGHVRGCAARRRCRRRSGRAPGRGR